MAEKIVIGKNGEIVDKPVTPKKESDTPRKEPTFAAPSNNKAPSDNGADSHANNTEGDAPAERKLPMFKDSRGRITSSPDGIPNRDILPKKKERKLPVFADEVNQHEDFNEDDDIDFTSDSIAFPIVNADASDFNKGKKDKKGKNKKSEPKDFFTEDPNAEALNSMTEADELMLLGGTMPSVVPYGNAYPDYDSYTTSQYVPTYEEENNIMKDYTSTNTSENEPIPQYDPFVQETKQSSKETATQETESLSSYREVRSQSYNYSEPVTHENNSAVAQNTAVKENKESRANEKVYSAVLAERVRRVYEQDRDEDALEKLNAANERKLAKKGDKSANATKTEKEEYAPVEEKTVKVNKKEVYEEVKQAKAKDKEDKKAAKTAKTADEPEVQEEKTVQTVTVEKTVDNESDNKVDNKAERKAEREKARAAREDMRLDAKELREEARADAKAEKERRDNERPIDYRILSRLELIKEELDAKSELEALEKSADANNAPEPKASATVAVTENYSDDVPPSIHQMLDPDDLTEKRKKDHLAVQKALYIATNDAEEQRINEIKDAKKEERLDKKEAENLDRDILREQKRADAGNEEAAILLAAHKAERQRRIDAANAAIHAYDNDPYAESVFGPNNNKGIWSDRGEEEAAVLLELVKTEKEGRKEIARLRKENPPTASKADDKIVWSDSGVEEAATLLSITEAAKDKNKNVAPIRKEYDNSDASQMQKRADEEALAVVHGGKYAPALDDEGALEIMQKSRDDEAFANLMEARKQARKQAKKDANPKEQLKKKTEYEALAIVYGPEYAKKAMENSGENNKPEEPIKVYSDPELNVRAKTKEEIEADERERAAERRRTAEFEALTVVYGIDYAKRVFAEREAREEAKRKAAEDQATNEVAETPVEEAPVQETPVEETPVQETPVEETPVQETPVEEAPVYPDIDVDGKDIVNEEDQNNKTDDVTVEDASYNARNEETEREYPDIDVDGNDVVDNSVNEKQKKLENEVSTESYDDANDKKATKKQKKEELLAYANQQSSKNQKKTANETETETVYGDDPYDEGYTPEHKPTKAELKSEAKAAKKDEKNASKQEKNAQNLDNAVSSYESSKDNKADAKSEKAALIAVADAEAIRRKEEKALDKAERKAQKNAVPEKPAYGDDPYDEGYTPEHKPTNSEIRAEQRAAKKDAKYSARKDAAEAKDHDVVAAYEEHLDKKLGKSEEKSAIVATYNDQRTERSEAKAAAKEERKAQKNAPVAETVYNDEPYDEEYTPEYKPGKSELRSEKREAKAEARSEKAQNKQQDAVDAYEEYLDKKLGKSEEKSAIVATYNDQRTERSAAKAAAKEERKAQKSAPVAETVYNDEPYDEGYTPEYKPGKAELRSEKREANAEARSEKAQNKQQNAVEAYEEHLDKKLAKEEKLDAIVAAYEEQRKARSDAKTAAKEERKAQKNAPVAENVYPDAPYDEGYTPEPIDDGSLERAEKKAAKEQKKTDSATAKYDKYSEKREHRAAIAAALIAFYNNDKAETKRAIEEAAKSDKQPEEKVYPDADYETGYYPKTPEQIAEEAYRTKLEIDNENLELLSVFENKKLEAYERRQELLATAKDAKELEYLERQRKREAYAKTHTDIVYPDGVYEEEYIPEPTAKELKTEAKAVKTAERKEANAAKALSKGDALTEAYTGHLDAKEQKAEAKKALAQTYIEDHKARSDAKAADKAAREAAKNVEVIYPDGVYEEEYIPEPTAKELKAKAKTEKLEALAKERHTEKLDLEAHDIEQYELYNANKALRSEEKKQLLEDGKTKPKAENVYPDPVFDNVDKDVDILNNVANTGDVVEGAGVVLTGVKDIRRAQRDDKHLEMLISKDKKRAKKLMLDMETLELAEKYSSNSSLELANAATVEHDDEFYKQENANLKAVRAYEKDMENKALMSFRDEYNAKQKTAKRRAAKAEKAGKFTREYGASYDPEFDGEFNNYNLPEVHPYTEGVKLSESHGKRRHARREKLSYVDEKKLSGIADMQCKTDIAMIEHRIRAQHTQLDLELTKSEWQFSHEYEARKEVKWRKNAKKKLRHLKAKLTGAISHERMDNRRYYSVVATNFETVELPRKADRDDLIAMREELMRLLDIRDDLNAKLLELYSGTENGMKPGTTLKGRARAEIRARKRAYRKYRKLYRLLNKMRVTRNEKMRIFNKMDQYLDTKGELAKIKYILKNERPMGRILREYKRDKRKAKSDLRILRRVIDRTSIKALRRAKKRSIQKRVMAISYTILILIVLGICAISAMGPQILEAIKGNVPENILPILEKLLGGGNA